MSADQPNAPGSGTDGADGRESRPDEAAEDRGERHPPEPKDEGLGVDLEELDLPAPTAELEAEARVNPKLQVALEEVGRLKAKVRKEKKKRKKAQKKAKGAGSLGTNRGIETMFRTSYRTHIDLSSLADTKANIMISINGIIISILLASISPKIDANPWLLIPTSVLLLGCLTAILYAVMAARPRVSSQPVSLEDVKANRKNILFFGNFVNMPEEVFVEGMHDLMQDTDRLYTNMIRDLYSLGGVLATKFRLLRVSYTLFMIALTIGVFLYIGVFVAVAFFGLGAPPIQEIVIP